MSKPIQFNHVWKKFKKGERFNSLRDAIPNVVRQLTHRNNSNEVLENQEFWAVKDVDFEIEQGDVVGIMGPNGAGKSTILKLLSRIIIPNQGEIKIKGRLSALIEITAGFHPELTGRENVYLNGTILGMKKKEIDKKFDDIVDFSGIKEFIDTPVKRYSSGMFSRLGFSVAANMDPDILLVDEVLSVGDMSFQAKCAQKMRDLLKSGATIVLVSHQLNLIQSLCKRVILLNHGEIVNVGPVDEIIPEYQNIVFRKGEAEFKKEIKSQQYRVKVDTRPLMEIVDVSIFNEKNEKKDNFSPQESIKVEFNFEIREKISSPIFMLEIVRSDGVLCCISQVNSKDEGVELLDKNGSARVDLGVLNLGPGIYLVKLTVWDKEMIHPYAIRNKDVLRIAAEGQNKLSNAIFFPKTEWSLD